MLGVTISVGTAGKPKIKASQKAPIKGWHRYGLDPIEMCRDPVANAGNPKNVEGQERRKGLGYAASRNNPSGGLRSVRTPRNLKTRPADKDNGKGPIPRLRRDMVRPPIQKKTARIMNAKRARNCLTAHAEFENQTYWSGGRGQLAIKGARPAERSDKRFVVPRQYKPRHLSSLAIPRSCWSKKRQRNCPRKPAGGARQIALIPTRCYLRILQSAKTQARWRTAPKVLCAGSAK